MWSLSSPGMEKTNGTLKQIDQGLRLYSSSSSGVVFVDYAGNGALLRFAYRTVAPCGVLRWSSGRRSACYYVCLAHPLRSELAEASRPNQVDMKIMNDPA